MVDQIDCGARYFAVSLDSVLATLAKNYVQRQISSNSSEFDYNRDIIVENISDCLLNFSS